MKLIVGLGNPGPEYAGTRHNAGFAVVDRLAARIAPGAAPRSRFSGLAVEAQVGDEKCLLLKPTTYMNAAGEAVGPALRFYKLGLEDLVVVHDDLELAEYRVQLKVGGGHGGNNGVKSVNSHVGGTNYARVRVGVGRPPQFMDPADYVLGKFPKGAEAELEDCLERATEAARLACELGAAKAMNQINRRQKDAGGAGQEG